MCDDLCVMMLVSGFGHVLGNGLVISLEMYLILCLYNVFWNYACDNVANDVVINVLLNLLCDDCGNDSDNGFGNMRWW